MRGIDSFSGATDRDPGRLMFSRAAQEVAVAAEVEIDFGVDREIRRQRDLGAARPERHGALKQTDQPAASSCSGFVPRPGPPGTDSLTSRRPSLLRADPLSRPPVV